MAKVSVSNEGMVGKYNCRFDSTYHGTDEQQIICSNLQPGLQAADLLLPEFCQMWMCLIESIWPRQIMFSLPMTNKNNLQFAPSFKIKFLYLSNYYQNLLIYPIDSI